VLKNNFLVSDPMTNPFELFDKLLNDVHLYPLDAQHQLVTIQDIDNKIVNYTRKLHKYFKGSLKLSRKTYNKQIKKCLASISHLNRKRKAAMSIIMECTREIYADMQKEYPEELKSSIGDPSKNPSVFKTRVSKEDVNNNIKQPKYCLCRASAFGDMIRCDDPGCKVLWYHFECVGLVHTPKGNWYCSTCKKNRTKRM
ncbi:Chromatin remodeling protein, contains PHD Zn-finger, partial [Trachipleistophora hominis]